jgi:hypothetical protein
MLEPKKKDVGEFVGFSYFKSPYFCAKFKSSFSQGFPDRCRHPGSVVELLEHGLFSEHSFFFFVRIFFWIL